MDSLWNRALIRSCLLIIGMSFAFLGATASNLTRVTLGWDPSPTPDIAGYRIYSGIRSQTYTSIISVGNVTTATVSNLVVGTTYFFAVSAYDAAGSESPLSGEISYKVGTPPSARLQLVVTSGRRAVITATGPAGYRYELQTSQDSCTWTPLANVTMDAKGFLRFTEMALPTPRTRAYRLRQIFP